MVSEERNQELCCWDEWWRMQVSSPSLHIAYFSTGAYHCEVSLVSFTPDVVISQIGLRWQTQRWWLNPKKEDLKWVPVRWASPLAPGRRTRSGRRWAKGMQRPQETLELTFAGRDYLWTQKKWIAKIVILVSCGVISMYLCRGFPFCQLHNQLEWIAAYNVTKTIRKRWKNMIHIEI